MMEIRRAERKKAMDRAMSVNPALFSRLMSNADASLPCQCWTWLLAKDRDGYGSLKVAGKNIKAHKAMHGLFYPHHPAQVVRHLCNNPSCVNPLHLRTGTPKDNAEDRVVAGRGGDLAGENNGRSKLTNNKVLEIRSSSASGSALAAKHGVSRVMVSRIRRGLAWSHI